jgi:hypothetical protein
MATRTTLALAALVFAAVPAHALPRRLPPLEQCSGDRSFVTFLSALKQVVAKWNRAAFLKMLAPDVLVNFGSANGREAFASEWSFDPKEAANVWGQLAMMLKMGCARDDDVRIIPSLIMQADADEGADWVLILPGARLYKEIRVASANPTVEPWTVANVTSRAGDLVTGVKLPDGRIGYISDDQLYEPGGHRMTIEKRGGKWTITAFVAGD